VHRKKSSKKKTGKMSHSTTTAKQPMSITPLP
jgi:hypothetical protein